LTGRVVADDVELAGGGPSGSVVLFSHIGGNLNLSNITATDPEDDGNAAVSVVVNTIGRNLNCQNLGPRLTGGAVRRAPEGQGPKCLCPHSTSASESEGSG
jgi:hypothetical protein